jgi:hypothetical protein
MEISLSLCTYFVLHHFFDRLTIILCPGIKRKSCTVLEDFFPPGSHTRSTPQEEMNSSLVCLIVFFLAIFGIPYLETFQDFNPDAASRPAFLPIQTTIIYSLGGLLFTQSACQLLSATSPCTDLGMGVGTVTAVGHMRMVWDDGAWRMARRMKDDVENMARTKLGLLGERKEAV